MYEVLCAVSIDVTGTNDHIDSAYMASFAGLTLQSIFFSFFHYFSFIAIAFGVIGIILSMISTSTCTFFRLGRVRSRGVTMGIWNYVNARTGNSFFVCSLYPESQSIGSRLQTARAMSIISPFLAVASLFLCFLAIHDKRKKNASPAGTLGTFLMVLATIAQGLTLLVLESDLCLNNSSSYQTVTHCTLLYGAKISIATILLFFTSTMIQLLTTMTLSTDEATTTTKTKTIVEDPPQKKLTPAQAPTEYTSGKGVENSDEELEA